MAISASPQCLDCGYDLTGLPPEHVCPECASPYDSQTCVWTRPARRSWLTVDWGRALILALSAVLVLVVSSRGLSRVLTNPLLASQVLTLLVVIVLLALLRVRVAPSRVGLSPRGILVEIGQQVWIPWNEVQTVRATWFGTVIKRRARWSAWRLTEIALTRAFESRAEAGDFRERVRRRMADHA